MKRTKKYNIIIYTSLILAIALLAFGARDYLKSEKEEKNTMSEVETTNDEEIISYLNKAKCALIPTKHDTQGVMACEMATFGIPTITSNIEVCREIFSSFENVKLIDNINLLN